MISSTQGRQASKRMCEWEEVGQSVGISHSNLMCQRLGSVAYQFADIFQSEDLFIRHLHGVIYRKVMFLKK